jgi:hypothetical protein
MRIHHRNLRFASVGALMLLGATARADATPPSPEAVAARRELVTRAQGERDAGNHKVALDLAMRAGQIKTSVSLRRFIAEEQSAVGNVAAALGTADLCEREAKAAGPDADAHVEACAALAVSMRKKVGYISVQPNSRPDGLTINVAGIDVPSALWEQRFPVTPGTLPVEARARGLRPFSGAVAVAPGQVVVLPIVLVHESVAEVPAPTGAMPPPVAEAKWKMSPLVPIGGGVLLAGAALATTFAIVAGGKISNYKSRCVTAGAPTTCVDDQVSVQQSVNSSALLVDVGLIVAAVGVVATTTGLFLSGKNSSHTGLVESLATGRF